MDEKRWAEVKRQLLLCGRSARLGQSVFCMIPLYLERELVAEVERLREELKERKEELEKVRSAFLAYQNR